MKWQRALQFEDERTGLISAERDGYIEWVKLQLRDATMSLGFHQSIFDLLVIQPCISDERTAAIASRERLCECSFPKLVRSLVPGICYHASSQLALTPSSLRRCLRQRPARGS